MRTTGENGAETPVQSDTKAEILQQEVIDAQYDNDDEGRKIAVDESLNAQEAAKVLRKIDWHLVPVLVLVNAIQLIDKNVRISKFLRTCTCPVQS